MWQTLAMHEQHDTHPSTGDKQQHVDAQHIVSLAEKIRKAPGQSQFIPDYVTGVRRQYLEAVQTEARAKQEYEVVRADGSGTDVSGRQTHEDVLLNHVNALGQRQQHVKLYTLAHYVEEFEKLLPSESVRFELDGYKNVTGSAERNLESQRQQAASLTRGLEVAVLEAKAQADREKAALQAAQAGLDVTTTSPTSRLQGLVAVRNELTTWIENSLAACGIDDSQLENVAEDQQEDIESRSIKGVEEAYEGYLEARRRVIAATEALSAPLPSLDGEAERNTERTSFVLEADSVVAAEARFPVWQDNRALAAPRTYAQAQLKSEQGEATQTLRRLADESHLLAAYPLLAKSGRFRHVVSKHDGKDRGQEDQIGSKIEAWTFATGAADIATSGAIVKHVGSGNAAIEGAKEMLNDMKLLQHSASKAND